MAQFNLVKMTALFGRRRLSFSFINHTKLDYIAVADNCQSNFVESDYNLITKTNRRKNYAGMVDKLSTVPFCAYSLPQKRLK